MMNIKTNSNTTFKKSVLSFVVVSALASAFIPWEEYAPRSETPAMTVFYENSDALQEQVVSQSILSIDTATLAEIAEENLISELDAEVDEQVLLSAQAFSEQSDSPEAVKVIEHSVEEVVFEETKSTPVEALLVQDSKITLPAPKLMEKPLLFSFDSSEIDTEYYQALNETAMFMQSTAEQNNSVWQVVGYADLSGNRIYNGKLAKQRAQKVAAYLVDKGVPEEQLSIVSLGASNPIKQQRSVENNRFERRVEIHAYQAEVTALVDQYNKQLQREIAQATKLKAQQKNNQQVAQQRAEAEQQPIVKATIEENKRIEPKVVENHETKNEQPLKREEVLTERLTTAMEL